MKIKPLTLIRIGLALVFLANSLTAFLSPAEFIDIINDSFLSGILPITVTHFLVFIGVNDALVAIFLFLNRGKKIIPVWATLWILGAIIIKGFSLGILEEAGFLFMALALAVNNNNES